VSYVVESGASSSRRARRRRALITLAVVALMLFFAFWYAYSYYRSSGEPRATPVTSCTTTATAPAPGKITVNVYNATERSGLAARTATEVRKRGFKVSTVSNDPLARQVVGTAEVRYGKTGAPAGKLVIALVKGAKGVQDARVDGSVDLVLGDKFTALVAAPKPAAKPAASKPAASKPATSKPAATTSGAKPSATKPTASATSTSGC
jgi:LytR cell envelope-related transcriptional attenuator